MLRAIITSLFIYGGAANLEIFTQRFSADPAPLVVEDRVFMYTSHDINDQAGWLMTDYNCFSSDDLVNWRDEGIVFTIHNQTWGEYAWAQQVIFNPHTQLYTMFYPGMNARPPPANSATGTGVATSSSPLLGRFKMHLAILSSLVVTTLQFLWTMMEPSYSVVSVE